MVGNRTMTGYPGNSCVGNGNKTGAAVPIPVHKRILYTKITAEMQNCFGPDQC